MTNKPMLSVELRKALADFIEYSVPGPRSDDAMWYADKQALRALLDAQHVVCSNGILCQNSKCAECGGNGAYKPAAQHQGNPVAWSYCPECGCEELHHEEGDHKQCKNCHQEWFSDIDYSEVVRGNLQKLKAEQPAPVAVVMPERKCPSEYRDSSYTQTCMAGEYNRALDDAARLNGVKP